MDCSIPQKTITIYGDSLVVGLESGDNAGIKDGVFFICFAGDCFAAPPNLVIEALRAYEIEHSYNQKNSVGWVSSRP